MPLCMWVSINIRALVIFVRRVSINIWGVQSTAHVFNRVRVARYLVFCVVFCRSLFGQCSVLSVIRFMASGCPFGISNRFVKQWWSTIPPISHLTSMHWGYNKKKKQTTTYDIVNLDPGLRHAQKMPALKINICAHMLVNGFKLIYWHICLH